MEESKAVVTVVVAIAAVIVVAIITGGLSSLDHVPYDCQKGCGVNKVQSWHGKTDHTPEECVCIP